MGRLYVIVVPRYLAWGMVILACCLVVLAIYGSFPLAVYTIALLPEDVIYDVMLDAGHGGIDPGAIGNSDVYEKHFTLDIVLEMGRILTEHGLKVGLTRDTDRDVSHLVENGTRHRRDLLGRFKMMNQARVGMSVHANSTKNSSESGAIVFYLHDSYIDKLFAQIVFDELERVQVMNHNYVVPRSTLLLLKAKVPVLLVEVGFMSNPQDLAKLADRDFRVHVAQALSTGILKFLAAQNLEQSEP